VTGNVFHANEMGGMSCWSANEDHIVGNTFVSNLREGLSVLGASRPTVEKNVFADMPVAVLCADVG
jgi:parallel beta-helix repeat protein